MSKRMDVGRTWRTPAKHAMMRSFIGQESGAGGMMSPVRRHVWIDLTAGDAITDHEWRSNCSPGILANHAVQAKKPVSIRLNEIQANTFDKLIASLEEQLPALGYRQTDETEWTAKGGLVCIVASNQSGHEVDVSDILASDAVAVLNDPNAITDWAMRPTLAAELARRTPWSRCLSTMGCNAAGIKRLDGEIRSGWFDHIEQQEQASPRYRDLLLAALDGDSAQWAYLISSPQKWREKTKVVVKTAFKTVDRTATMAWFGTERRAFDELKRVLFMTKSERAE